MSKAMLMRAMILTALVAVLAVPFMLRPAITSGRADDTVVIISPHNEAIRQEFAHGFAQWYRARTGRTVRVDWRVVGGTSEISRYLAGAYVAAFRNEWSGQRRQPWTAAVEAGFQDPHGKESHSVAVRSARAAFLASNVSCGIDVFFGGDAYQYAQEAAAGRLVDAGIRLLHPDWFDPAVMPSEFRGEPFWDRAGRWFGVVLSSYGILFNRDSCRRLGLADEPRQWSDLAAPALFGEVGLADPTKSGSVCEAFENIIQQQMEARWAALRQAEPAADPATLEARAVREGWLAGLRLIQEIGANARYFTDDSQKPPIDVATGECAAGLCIDFYGRQEQEAVRRRGDLARLGFVAPVGGSAASTDPVALLRGAPHRDVGTAFIEYTLSLAGQKLWAFRPGTPGGPARYALRRIPIRRDFYDHAEWRPLRSDPGDDPYAAATTLTYHAPWTGRLFREIGFITRVMCLDTHAELADAWRAILAAPEPARSRGLAILHELAPVGYDRTLREVHARLSAPDRVEEIRLATELGAYFRGNYRRAAAVARGR